MLFAQVLQTHALFPSLFTSLCMWICSQSHYFIKSNGDRFLQVFERHKLYCAPSTPISLLRAGGRKSQRRYKVKTSTKKKKKKFLSRRWRCFIVTLQKLCSGFVFSSPAVSLQSCYRFSMHKQHYSYWLDNQALSHCQGKKKKKRGTLVKYDNMHVNILELDQFVC